MARLQPINAARCPHCLEKQTRRVGFSPAQKASIWQCAAAPCGKLFTVPLLVLSKRVA